MIDATFRNINTLLILSFKNGDDDPAKNYFHKYHMPLVEIKKFNALIDNKPFFDQPMKNKQEPYGKSVEMSRNGDYNIIKLYCKLILYDKQIPVFLNKLILLEN